MRFDSMKITKSPLIINKSIALIIPDAFVKSYEITKKSRFTLISAKGGFRIKVRK